MACSRAPPPEKISAWLASSHAKNASIAEHAVFGDFGIAGAELARRQRIQHRGIRDHQNRLVKRADQIFSMRRVDAGLAADGGIDLRQQRGRHLHEIDAAAQDRGGKARKVADHAAAERDHEVVALDFCGDQFLGDVFEAFIAFRDLALVDDDPRRGDAGVEQRRFGPAQPMRRNVFVGDDGDPRTRPQRGDAAAQRGQHAAADDDVIGALAECDVDHDGIGVFQRRGHRVAPTISPVVSLAPQRCRCNAAMHSSTIFSCSTSREAMVMSASS